MKEIAITTETTIKMPTSDEYKEVAKNGNNEPQQALIISCYVGGYDIESEANKAVYECMKEADTFYRNSIANEVATAYCEEHNIKWGTLRVINVSEYGKHFIIEAIVTTRA